MKRIKFRASNVPLILDGSKTATWRMKDEKNLTIGDEVVFTHSDTLHDFANAVLTDVKTTSIRNFTEADAEGNIDFPSKDEMLAWFRNQYGDDITLDTPLKVVRFKITEVLND